MEALRGAVLGSSAGQRAKKLREAHPDKVARNEVRASPLWAQPCRAYNVHIELAPHTEASLGKTQQRLLHPNFCAALTAWVDATDAYH
jgi:hypothetical protein